MTVVGNFSRGGCFSMKQRLNRSAREGSKVTNISSNPEDLMQRCIKHFFFTTFAQLCCRLYRNLKETVYFNSG